MLSPKITLAVTIMLSLGASLNAAAQISTYDSMYFPTTQSLEGTRAAPRIYSVFEVDFGQLKSEKPSYFADLKQAYIIPLTYSAPDFTQNDIDSFAGQSSSADTSVLFSQVALSTLQSKVKMRLLGEYAQDMHVMMEGITVEQLDQVDADSFDFRNGKGKTQTDTALSLSRLENASVNASFYFE